MLIKIQNQFYIIMIDKAKNDSRIFLLEQPKAKFSNFKIHLRFCDLHQFLIYLKNMKSS